MKYLISAVLFALSFAPLAVRADMLPDNSHGVDNCVSLDNTSAFPEYTFFVHTESAFPGTTAVGQTPVCSLRGTAGLFGIKTTDLSKIVKLPADDEQAGAWPSQGSNGTLLYPVGRLVIDFSASLPDSNPTVKRNYTIHVIDIGVGQGNKSPFNYMKAQLVNTEGFDAAGKLTESKATPYREPLQVVFEDTFRASGHMTDTAVVLSNLSDFDDYSFFLSGRGISNFPNEMNVVAFSTKDKTWLRAWTLEGTFFAVKNSDLDKLTRGSDDWPHFAANVPYITWSRFPVTFPAMLPDDNNVQTIDDIYNIESVDKNELVVSPASRTYSTYHPKIAILEESARAKPQVVPSTTDSLAGTLKYVWVLLVCMGAVILVLAVKTWKK